MEGVDNHKNAVYTWHMSVTYGNPNYQKKFDAFRIILESKHEPLKEAIAVALEMRAEAQELAKAIKTCKDPETLSKLNLALARALPDQFNAWVKIAEFIYAKPRQQLDITGAVTLEQVLSASLNAPALNG